jgi:hypothetical protein
MTKLEESARMNRRITDEEVRRARLKQLNAALAEGERAIASGRVTTLVSDADSERIQ